MSLLAIAMFSAMDFVGRALNRNRSGSAHLQMLADRVVVRRWIEGMPPGAVFSGEAAQLTFVTIIDDGQFWPGAPAEVAIGCSDGHLVASAIQRSEAGGTMERSVALSSDCGGTSFRYFGALPPGGLPRWHDAWPPAARLPLLVRLDYSESGKSLPQLTVIPARAANYSEMSLSSPAPPG